jgi:hypothetical protein
MALEIPKSQWVFAVRATSQFSHRATGAFQYLKLVYCLPLRIEYDATGLSTSKPIAAASGKDFYYGFSETRQVSPIIPDKSYVPGWSGGRMSAPSEWFAH